MQSERDKAQAIVRAFLKNRYNTVYMAKLFKTGRPCISNILHDKRLLTHKGKETFAAPMTSVRKINEWWDRTGGIIEG